MLLERYMAVARQVSRLAVGDTTMMVAPVTYPIDSSLKQEDRASEDLPFGARGVTVTPHLSARRRLRDPDPAEADAERIHPRSGPQAAADRGARRRRARQGVC